MRVTPSERLQRALFGDWRQEMAALSERIAHSGARSAVRAPVGRFRTGLLGPVERHHGWLGRGGPSRRASRERRARAAWTRTRYGAGTAGTETSRTACWSTPSST